MSSGESPESGGEAARWRFIGHCFDGEPFAIDGIDVWRTWTATGEQATVADPIYPWQQYEFAVYTMTDGTRSAEFAAGEFSNTVWGFFKREERGPWLPQRPEPDLMTTRGTRPHQPPPSGR